MIGKEQVEEDLIILAPFLMTIIYICRYKKLIHATVQKSKRF